MSVCRHWCIAAALAALFGWTPSASASASPLQLLDGSGNMARVAVRARLARELAQEISSALRRISAPAPAESALVIEELAEIERLRDPEAVNTRAQRLYASAAFQQLRLANTLAVVRDALDCAASPYASVRREMTCWTIAAAYLADRDIYENAFDVLTRSGRLGYGAGMTRTRWLTQSALWARYGIAIQHYITIPFLRGVLD